MIKGLVFITDHRIAYALYVSILIFTNSPAFSDSTMPLAPVSQRITEFRYILDHDDNLNPQSVMLRFRQGHYQTVTDEAFNVGNSDDLFWILFSVLNDSTEAETRRLVFGTPFVPLLNAYLLTGHGAVTILQHDGKQPYHQRVNDRIKLNSIAFTLPAKQRSEFLVQYRPRGVSFLPVSLVTDAGFTNQLHLESVRASVFYSLSCTVIATFFFFGIAMRSRLALFYALLFLEYLFFLAIIEGYAFKYFWPDWPQWNLYSGLVTALVFSASGLLISSIVVEKTDFSRQFKFFCRRLALLSLLMLLLIPFSGNVMMMTINYIFMILMLLSQGYCIYSWMRQSSKRNMLAFYTALILIGATFYVFTLFLHSSALSEWMIASFNRGIYLFVSLTTMGTFAIHLGGLRNDHEKALRRELENAKRDAELNRELFESEQRYSQARELANKRQQQLASASHDIRQPLLSLRSTMDVMALKQSPEVRKHMHDAFNYIEQLCSHYLAETRPLTESPKKSECYSIKMIIDSVSKMFRQEALDKGLTFNVALCTVEIACPPMPLIRVVSNFVANAIKHCTPGTKLLIGCRRLSGLVKIDVYDNGPGITHQALKTLLEPYRKGDNSSGEGLGLAIVKELADSHGWEIAIDSTLGKGSRFSVIVPAMRSNGSR
ncbi:MAG: ATP-binding protein [Gammaproteobacteria bacterium]